MRTSPSLRGIVEQKRKFYRLIRFSTRNRGQFKIHRGVTLSRVYKSVVHKEDSRCSTRSYTPVSSPPRRRKDDVHPIWLIVSTGWRRAFVQIIRTKRDHIPSPPTKQNNRHRLRSCRRALRMLMKFLFSFTSLFSPLFFFSFFDFSFNSLRSTLLLRQFLPLIACFFPPISSPFPLFACFNFLFFERMPFSTPSKLFTSGLRYFQPSFLAWTARLGIFSASIVLTWPLYGSV